MDTHKQWTGLYADLVNEKLEQAKCPDCQGNLDSMFVAGENRMGYALIWCEDCKHGRRYSRVKVPAKFEYADMFVFENMVLGIEGVVFDR